MDLLYGFLVLGLWFSVYKSRNAAAIKVFGVIFIGWLTYVNFHPYNSSYSQAFNIILDLSLLASMWIVRMFHEKPAERRPIEWVCGIFVLMLANHITSMLISVPPLVYYTISNGLFLAQLMVVYTFARKSSRIEQERTECPRSAGLQHLSIVKTNSDAA